MHVPERRRGRKLVAHGHLQNMTSSACFEKEREKEKEKEKEREREREREKRKELCTIIFDAGQKYLHVNVDFFSLLNSLHDLY